MPSGFPEGIFVIIYNGVVLWLVKKEIAYRYLKEVVCVRFSLIEFHSGLRVVCIVNAFCSLTGALFNNTKPAIIYKAYLLGAYLCVFFTKIR